MKQQAAFFLCCLGLVCFSVPSLADDPSPTIVRDVRYKTTPSGDLHLDLYYPESTSAASTPTGGYPVVIYTHGGGWTAGSKKSAAISSMGRVVRGLTEQGFCVAAVDYRLWSKDGDVTIRDCVIDSKDAIRYLVKHGPALGIDTNRVFTFGDSAGGQIAQMLLLTAPDTLTGVATLADATYTMVAGVSWYGPCDFEKTELFNHDGRPDFRDRFGPRLLKPNTDPRDKLRLYREMSPINYLKSNSPPLLMVQGDKDTTIPVHHAHYMNKRAEKLRAPVEILIVHNAGHNWRKVDAAIQPSVDAIIETSVSFLKQQLTEHSNAEPFSQPQQADEKASINK